ncbi:hypothetical protein CB0940_08096 [Cercospora beticola]|uniref:Zn(2)-C6 fungal-type domain-containing protein n=2 Tax=Cercospora beticola TaxID=122368 RepID=A0A2G5HRJ9_CERBT|nr:hypothetical protein CB0940_08096 [Cercospora beticola]PIA94923.1 hypothetical protein CB0940_08096 [Cercospora beticola]
MTIPVVRKRAKKPKTRTGCRTCRARHIKCDEARPACRRCVASNRECAGYDVVRPSATAGNQCSLLLPKGGMEVELATASSSQPPLQALPLLHPHHPMTKPATFFTPMSTYEAHAYDFFRTKTIHQLPGSSWTMNWERLALQAGHYEPAITHAAIALGSIHRAVSAASPGSSSPPTGSPGAMTDHVVDRDQRFFALCQYNKALGLIRRYIEALGNGGTNRDVEVVLLVSLLFFCFEILVNEDDRATLHLRTGLRILYEKVRKLDEYRSPAREVDVEGQEKRVVRIQTRPRTNLDVLLQTFVRLDGDLTIVGDEEPYLFPVCHEKIPSSFFCLEEAMVHLDAIATAAHGVCRDIVMLADRELVMNRPEVDILDEDMRNCLACAYSRTISLPKEHQLRLDKIKSDVNAWMAALACWSVTDDKEPALLLTQINFFYTWFLVMSWRDENEMLIDRFDSQFEHILALIEQYIHAHGGFVGQEDMVLQAEHFPTTRQAFTVGTDVVPCIGMIAYKSRNSRTRRKGLRLLRAINLAGVFDAHYLAAFGQAVCDLEEEHARAINNIPEGVDLECHQVPEEARLVEIELGVTEPCEMRSSFYKDDTGRLIYAYYKDLETRELAVAAKPFIVNRSPNSQGPLYAWTDLPPGTRVRTFGRARLEAVMSDDHISDCYAVPETTPPEWEPPMQWVDCDFPLPEKKIPVMEDGLHGRGPSIPGYRIPREGSSGSSTPLSYHQMHSTMQKPVQVGYE